MLAGFALVAGAVWEPIFRHSHEQAVQVLGILLVAVWSWISLGLGETERKSIERTVFILLLALVCAMALFPYVPQAERRTLLLYRGTARWRGWTIDPNNAGVLLGLAVVAALRLRIAVSRRFSLLLLALATLCGAQLCRSFSRVGLLVLSLSLIAWLAPVWRAGSGIRRNRLLFPGLVLLLAVPVIVRFLRGTDVLLVRRAASLFNVMDLSWANRLYVLPGAIQQTLDRPLSGWG